MKAFGSSGEEVKIKNSGREKEVEKSRKAVVPLPSSRTEQSGVWRSGKWKHSLTDTQLALRQSWFWKEYLLGHPDESACCLAAVGVDMAGKL